MPFIADQHLLKFSKNLSEYLKVRGLNIKDLAYTTGVPATSISEWLQGRCPNVIAAHKIAKALNVSIETLVFGEVPEAHKESFELVLYRIGHEELREKIFTYRGPRKRR